MAETAMSDSDTEGLYVNVETEVDDLVEFIERRTKNPHVDGENIVWNYSRHPINPNGLYLQQKRETEFLIPYEVSGVWGALYSMLPDRVREAEVLVWKGEESEYYAYEQYYRQMTNERRLELKKSLARNVEKDIQERL
jgi:hypothetical protein